MLGTTPTSCHRQWRERTRRRQARVQPPVLLWQRTQSCIGRANNTSGCLGSSQTPRKSTKCRGEASCFHILFEHDEAGNRLPANHLFHLMQRLLSRGAAVRQQKGGTWEPQRDMDRQTCRRSARRPPTIGNPAGSAVASRVEGPGDLGAAVDTISRHRGRGRARLSHPARVVWGQRHERS
jgi:hypothetical protein